MTMFVKVPTFWDCAQEDLATLASQEDGQVGYDGALADAAFSVERDVSQYPAPSVVRLTRPEYRSAPAGCQVTERASTVHRPPFTVNVNVDVDDPL